MDQGEVTLEGGGGLSPQKVFNSQNHFCCEENEPHLRNRPLEIPEEGPAQAS